MLASLRWMPLLPLGVDGREVFPVHTVARMVIFSHAVVNRGTTTGAQSSILRSPAAKDSPPSPAWYTARRTVGFGGALAASLSLPRLPPPYARPQLSSVGFREV